MLTTDMNDWSLLREYVERRSEAAFESLVQRHLDMVYSAAWRQAGDADLAEEATQAVFVLLARKAPHLRGGVIIAGWLYRAACLTARRALRDQTRRRIKDREALEMRLTDSHNEVWTLLEPHLDAALANLGESDRTAIVLRFLERRSFRDVAATLNLSEDASKKRVSRALEKLRLVLTRQGVTLGVSAIVAALSARAIEAAPEGLLRSSVRASLSGGRSVGPGVGTLVAGVIREALISRLKWGAALAGLGLLLAVIGTFHWLTPKPGGPGDAKAAFAGETGGGIVRRPRRERLERTAPSATPIEGRAMILHVIADENDQPLAGVAVHAEFIVIPNSDHASFLTDAEGAAQIILPASASVGMSCWLFAPGRVPTSIVWDRGNVASLAPDYTLRLPHGRLVAGTVVDESGQPVAGATIHFQSEGMARDSRKFADYQGPMSLPQSDRLPPPVTDANGRWSANFISPRAKSLFGYLEHPEFATTQFGHIQPPDPVEPSTNMVLVLERGAAVGGLVRDTAGTPIEQAFVNLRDQLGRPYRWMKTDGDGHFEFPRVGKGEVFLRVDAKGFESGGNLSVQGGQATNLDIVLKAVALAGNSIIRGRMVSEDGGPIGGAGVGLAPGQPGLEGNHWGVDTDAEGRFAWTSAPDHPVKLVIDGPISDWEEQQVELAPDATEAVITLKPKSKILLHGTVLDQSNGNPLPEFKVLWAPGFTNGYVVNTSILTEGRDGEFAVKLLPEQVRSYSPPGTSTRLDFQAPGYVNKLVLLASGTNDIDLSIQLEPATDITGTVLRPDGIPAAGAKVFFRGEHFRFRVGQDCFLSTGDYPFAVDTRSEADGTFRIPKIDGIERLEVMHSQGWATVPLDSASTAVIQLQPWARINGVVRSSQGVLPGVDVRATQAGNAPEQMLFMLTAKTDPEGRFEFSQLPGGHALVFVPPPRVVPGPNRAAQDIQVQPGETINLTLSLPAQ